MTKRQLAGSPSIIIRFEQRTHTFRIYYARRLKAASSGLIKVRGLYIRKPNSDDVPDHATNEARVVLPEPEILAIETRLERHGAWLGTAVPLMQGTIPGT